MMNSINTPSPFTNAGGREKTLILVRHAKSSWSNETLADFDRPLNERGKDDAPKMAKMLRQNKIPIDGFISSPAKRAKKTAEFFMKEFERKEKDVILVPALYHASVHDFYETIEAADSGLKSIALFSHNPGITAFANELIKSVQIDTMPTCSVFAVKIVGKSWGNFKDSKKEFWFFEYPKNIS